MNRNRTSHLPHIKSFPHFLKHKYFQQLFSICIVMILLPCILSLYFTMYHSFQKLTLENQEYYSNSAQNYFNYFLEDLGNMTTLAYQISSDARGANNLAASLLINHLNKSPYYYGEATKVISSYQNAGHHALIGVYYPEQDWLITDSYKYDALSFITHKLNIYDPQKIDEISSFLQNSVIGQIDMLSLFSHMGPSGSLLLTVSTHIGQDRTPVSFLYQLDNSSIQADFLESARYEALQFVIFDGKNFEPLLSSGQNNIDFTSITVDWDSFKTSSSNTFSINQNGQEYSLYLTYNKTFDFYYGIIGSHNDIYRTSIQYFKTMQLVTFSSIGILLIMLFLLTYINYKPIYTLTQKLIKHTDSTEPSNIFNLSSAIDGIMDELNETNMILKDYLLENILIGNPVNKMLLERLDIANYHKAYQVHALSEIYLSTEERINLTEELSERFEVLSFIIDITMLDITVIICLIPQNDHSSHSEYLYTWINKHYPDAILYNGCIVNSIDDLRTSFLSCNIRKCRNKLNQPSNSNTKTMQLADEILKYLQDNFCDPNLSQSLVADKFNISTYTLSRLFKNQFGIGFTEFISGKRIEYAKQLLLTTDAPIGEIATLVGLPNLNYFSRIFKATQGISPTQFRNNATSDF